MKSSNRTIDISAYLQLVRAPNGITAMTNILAAGAVASLGHTLPVNWPVSVFLLCLASVCLYYFGMILNDVCDLEEDALERPTRPIPSGRVSRTRAICMSGVLMLLGLSFAFFVSKQSFFVALLLCVFIVSYDMFFKEGIVGALFMALCRYSNWLLGLSIVPLDSTLLLLPLPILFYIMSLTYLSKQETRAEKPEVIYLAAVLLGLCLLAMVLISQQISGFQLTNIGLILASAALVFYRLFKTLGNFTPKAIQTMIVWMIIGIIPLDALMAMLAGQYAVAVVILCLLPLCRFLSTRLTMT